MLNRFREYNRIRKLVNKNIQELNILEKLISKIKLYWSFIEIMVDANKTYYVYLSGKAKWVKAHKPDTWNYQHYPDADSLKIFKQLQKEGVLTVLKRDEDGDYFQLKRPSSKLMRGQVVVFTPPKIMDKDGVILEEGIAVGNGSDVTSKVQVYSYPKPMGGTGKAIRWEAMKVNNLVPFKSSSFKDEETRKQVEGLEEQPEPLW
jgi:hypothetical protein